MIIKAEERILILAPRGRDAEVMQQVLSRRNSACHLCLDLGDLRLQLEAEVGAILVTEGLWQRPMLAWGRKWSAVSQLSLVEVLENCEADVTRSLRRRCPAEAGHCWAARRLRPAG